MAFVGQLKLSCDPFARDGVSPLGPVRAALEQLVRHVEVGTAIIAVVGTPWYAVTPVSGRYTMANVAQGDYQLRLFHERALPENLRFLERRITVPEGGLALPLISISETGFIPAPHLNKFGKEYPPVANDGTYPGAPK